MKENNDLFGILELILLLLVSAKRPHLLL